MNSGEPFNPAKTKRATQLARNLRKQDTWGGTITLELAP
jgi:hypothetical protein